MRLESGSLIRNAFWLTSAKSLAFAVAFLLPVFLVRHMTQGEFGLYKQAFLAVNTIVTLFPLGFAMSAFYFLPREPERQGQIIFNIMLFYICVGAGSGLLLMTKPDLLAATFNSPELAGYAREIGLVVLFWTASSFFEVIPVAFGETYLAAVFVVAAHLSRALLLLAAAVTFRSLDALIHAALLHGILQTAALGVYLASRFPGFWRRFDWSMMRSQLLYALPLGGAALLWMVQTDLHNYVVSHRFGAATYALYAVGCFQLPLIGILQESVGSVMIARLSHLQKEGRSREILLLTAGMMRKLAALLFPIYLFCLVSGREIIAFLFTPEYLDSWPIFAVNLTLIPLGLIASAYDPIVRVYPKQLNYLLKLRIALMPALFLGLYFGTEYFQLRGAILSVVVVSLIERLVMTARTARMLNVTWSDLPLFEDLGWLALASAIAALCAWLTRSLISGGEPLGILAACGVVFALVYGAAVHFLNILTPEERAMIRDRAERVRLGRFLRSIGAHE